MLEVNWTLLAAQVVNFSIFFAVLYVVFFRRYIRALDERRKVIAERLDKAERDRIAQEKMREEMEDRLAALEREIDQKMRQAHHAAQLERERILADAESIADEMKMDAGVMIAEERERMIKQLRNEIALLSIDLAEQIILKDIDPESQKAVVESFFRERRPCA